MHFHETPLRGAYVIDLEKRQDERGFFARLFCAEAFAALGLETSYVQMNDSLSRQAGTLRGIHYQLDPAAETKVVRCIRGALWDLALDLRADSATFGQYFGTELSADNRRMIYAPKGFGHAFLTLADDTEVLYMTSAPYAPDYERGVRWDDPRFAIRWPATPRVISDKDRSHRDFDPAHHLGERAR